MWWAFIGIELQFPVTINREVYEFERSTPMDILVVIIGILKYSCYWISCNKICKMTKTGPTLATLQFRYLVNLSLISSDLTWGWFGVVSERLPQKHIDTEDREVYWYLELADHYIRGSGYIGAAGRDDASIIQQGWNIKQTRSSNLSNCNLTDLESRLCQGPNGYNY